MLVAVSDIHLGDRAANRTGFVDFIEDYLKPNARDISGVYLLGDIFDFWGRNSSSVILDNLEILRTICSLGFKVFYIVGNHDFIIADMYGDAATDNVSRALNSAITNLAVSSNQTATNANKRFRFIHGHQIDYWYVLPFYEAFCRAMCHIYESNSNPTDLWDLVQRYSQNLSPITSSRLAQLSKSTRSSIEYKLAGPLKGQVMSKEESVIVELALLNQFIEISRLCPEVEHNECFDTVRTEILRFCDHATALAFEFERINDLTRIGSQGTPEELVNQFLMAWANAHQWVRDQSKNGCSSREYKQLLVHLRRIAAMLTVNLRPDEFLIHGHGHQSYINLEIKDADAGCWLGHSGSFITVDDGTVSLSTWPLE
jgi:UDP-2,3-diacylglucosamine pyrophosphatase LpxH